MPLGPHDLNPFSDLVKPMKRKKVYSIKPTTLMGSSNPQVKKWVEENRKKGLILEEENSVYSRLIPKGSDVLVEGEVSGLTQLIKDNKRNTMNFYGAKFRIRPDKDVDITHFAEAMFIGSRKNVLTENDIQQIRQSLIPHLRIGYSQTLMNLAVLWAPLEASDDKELSFIKAPSIELKFYEENNDRNVRSNFISYNLKKLHVVKLDGQGAQYIDALIKVSLRLKAEITSNGFKLYPILTESKIIADAYTKPFEDFNEKLNNSSFVSRNMKALKKANYDLINNAIHSLDNVNALTHNFNKFQGSELFKILNTHHDTKFRRVTDALHIGNGYTQSITRTRKNYYDKMLSLAQNEINITSKKLNLEDLSRIYENVDIFLKKFNPPSDTYFTKILNFFKPAGDRLTPDYNLNLLFRNKALELLSSMTKNLRDIQELESIVRKYDMVNSESDKCVLDKIHGSLETVKKRLETKLNDEPKLDLKSLNQLKDPKSKMSEFMCKALQCSYDHLVFTVGINPHTIAKQKL